MCLSVGVSETTEQAEEREVSPHTKLKGRRSEAVRQARGKRYTSSKVLPRNWKLGRRPNQS